MSTEARRAELLQIARRSRIKWILEARDVNYNSTTQQPSSSVTDALKSKVPGADCIQKVLNFLSEVVKDGESCDVSSIIAGLIEYDDYEEDNLQMKSSNFGKADGFEDFIHKLILPASVDITKAMQQFVAKFFTDFQESKNRGSEEEFQNWSGSLWTFLDHITEMMRENPIWLDETTLQFEASKNHCEKFIFTKLYPILFASDFSDVNLNERTRERIEALGFLTTEHLDIKCLRQLYQQHISKSNLQSNAIKHSLTSPSSSFVGYMDETDFINKLLEVPMNHLTELNHARCPQDKLLCIKRCTMAIAAILKECRTDGSLPGADELLPMMIFTIKLCNPSNLHSHLKYLQRYTRPSFLIAEAGYLLTNFVSAVYFLDNVDAKALTIEPEEFDRALARSKLKAKAANASAVMQLQKKQQQLAENKKNNRGNNGESDDVSIEQLLVGYRKAIQLNNKTDAISVKDIYLRRKYASL